MGSAVPSTSDGKEEQFLFRCQSDKLAHRIREVLRGSPGARKEDLEMELTWVSNTEGFFTISGEEYPCQLLNLPGVVESYKTYNDVNLVKSSDIGQVILVRDIGTPPVFGLDFSNGVTPPMRNAQRRHFKPKKPSVDPHIVQEVEEDLSFILSGTAIDGVKYTDVEEVWEEDEDGKGQWRPVTSGTKAAKVSSRRAAPGASRRSGTKKAVPKGLSFSQDIEEI